MSQDPKTHAVKAWHLFFSQSWRLPIESAVGARLLLRLFLRLFLIGGSVSGGWGLYAIAAQAQSTRLPAGDPRQVPTARYGRGEAVDLSLIVEEWRDRYPAIPIYACNCNADTCGDVSVWPFRDFTRYQSFVALGAFNAANSEETGFNCFDMETGERPEI